MAIREQALLPQAETLQSPETTSIGSHVSWIVKDLEKDRDTIPIPYNLCIRADIAMVAALQLVVPELPEPVQQQVNQLIPIHEECIKPQLRSPKSDPLRLMTQKDYSATWLPTSLYTAP